MNRSAFSWIGLWSVLAIAANAFAHDPVPHWQQATAWPDRIIVTIERDPQTSFSVTWRTHRFVGQTIAQIAPESANARFDLDAETETADTETVVLETHDDPDGERDIVFNQGLEPVNYHSVTFRDLQPDTPYAYRVRGDAGKWSPWRHVRTAPESGPVSFLFFGDAQTGIRSHITRIFDTASAAAPNARFMIHGGDLVNKGEYDKEWAEWFEAGGRSYVTLPSIPVPGNHDYTNYSGEKLFIANREVTFLWRPQFALPVVEELPDLLHETVYDIRYTNDLHIFAIDSSGVEFDVQMNWLARSLDASAARWRVVTMHHPLFSFVGGTEHPSAKERREQLLDVLSNHDVDMVLTGHRHTYQRAEFGEDVGVQAVGDPHGVKTMLVVTASSTKRGETKVEGWDRYREEQNGAFNLVRHADYIPIFAVVDIDGETLSYRAIDAVGEVYDAFTITKSDDGTKTLTNGPEASGPTKDKNNMAPYKSWNDLR